MTITIGASATVGFTVTDDDTAIALGSGDVPVLGTPRLIAWCERATVAALEPELEPGTTTVGSEIRVDHLAPTAVGGAVSARAEVTEVDGRRITLAVEVIDSSGVGDGGGIVARGTIGRVLVDRERFVSRLAEPGG